MVTNNPMQRLLLLAILLVLLSGCTDEEGARKALDNEGFTDINFTGYQPGVCSDSDANATGFVATNMHGKRVRGVVCSGGWEKGSTVRW